MTYSALCDKVCQWHAAGLWFSPGTPVSCTNKTDPHDITEILLNVAQNTLTLTLIFTWFLFGSGGVNSIISEILTCTCMYNLEDRYTYYVIQSREINYLIFPSSTIKFQIFSKFLTLWWSDFWLFISNITIFLQSPLLLSTSDSWEEEEMWHSQCTFVLRHLWHCIHFKLRTSWYFSWDYRIHLKMMTKKC